MDVDDSEETDDSHLDVDTSHLDTSQMEVREEITEGPPSPLPFNVNRYPHTQTFFLSL